MALVVFSGGARSGKSAAATRLAYRRSLDGAPVTVVVFGEEDGAEMSQRIARHREDRPEGFVTIESSDGVSWLDGVDSGELVLVDCLGTLLGRIMAAEWPDDGFDEAPADSLPEGYDARVTEAFDAVVARIAGRQGDMIVVTNEVGDGLVPTFATGRLFRDLLGRANRALVSEADAAYLVVAGRMLDLASAPSEASWPED